jgi:hypothetical protein
MVGRTIWIGLVCGAGLGLVATARAAAQSRTPVADHPSHRAMDPRWTPRDLEQFQQLLQQLGQLRSPEGARPPIPGKPEGGREPGRPDGPAPGRVPDRPGSMAVPPPPPDKDPGRPGASPSRPEAKPGEGPEPFPGANQLDPELRKAIDRLREHFEKELDRRERERTGQPATGPGGTEPGRIPAEGTAGPGTTPGTPEPGRGGPSPGETGDPKRPAQAAEPGTPPAERGTPPAKPQNLEETIEKIKEAAKAASQAKGQERKEATEGKAEGPGLGDSFSLRLETTTENLLAQLEKLKEMKPPTESPWWKATSERTGKWFEQFRTQTGKAFEGVKMPEVTVKLGSPSELPRMPNLEPPQMPDAGTLKGAGIVVVVAGVGVAVVVFLLRARFGRRAGGGEDEPRFRGSLPSSIANRQDLVRAFDTVALARLGREARWWTHGRVTAELRERAELPPAAAEDLAEVYEAARYTPAEVEVPPERLADAGATLRRLYHA